VTDRRRKTHKPTFLIANGAIVLSRLRGSQRNLLSRAKTG
jgi:hypothetical protein